MIVGPDPGCSHKILCSNSNFPNSNKILCSLGTPSKKNNFIFSDIESKCMSGSGYNHTFRSIRNNDKLVVSEGVEARLSLLICPLQVVNFGLLWL